MLCICGLLVRYNIPKNIESQIDADLVDDWQGYDEWIDQVDDEWI